MLCCGQCITTRLIYDTAQNVCIIAIPLSSVKHNRYPLDLAIGLKDHFGFTLKSGINYVASYVLPMWSTTKICFITSKSSNTLNRSDDVLILKRCCKDKVMSIEIWYIQIHTCIGLWRCNVYRWRLPRVLQEWKQISAPTTSYAARTDTVCSLQNSSTLIET